MNSLQNIFLKGLKEVYSKHQTLGDKGKELVEKNQFNETALLADISAEKHMINFLKQNKIPIRIISEEHGEINIMDNPQYLGIMDGIDGTFAYKTGKGRYGTLFAVFDNLNPKYKDYLFCGMMEHSEGNLFYSIGKGSFKEKIKDSSREQIFLNKKSEFNIYNKIGIDKSFEINKKTFLKKLSNYDLLEDFKSSADIYSRLLSNQADFVLECTRKKNLELAVFYGLINEAGGVMQTLDGKSLGEKKYLNFGQGEKEHIPIISSSNQRLANELRKYLL